MTLIIGIAVFVLNTEVSFQKALIGDLNLTLRNQETGTSLRDDLVKINYDFFDVQNCVGKDWKRSVSRVAA